MEPRNDQDDEGREGDRGHGIQEYRYTGHLLHIANALLRHDFILWMEMQHDARDWEAVGRMWKACPHAKAVPGVRVAYTDEREIQLPQWTLARWSLWFLTVRTVEEGKAARDWTTCIRHRQA